MRELIHNEPSLATKWNCQSGEWIISNKVMARQSLLLKLILIKFTGHREAKVVSTQSLHLY